MMRAMVLAAAALHAPPASAQGDPAAVACHAFTPEADHAETTVVRQLEGGEVTLRVPREYFEDAWDRRGGFRDTAQLFRVEIGSFDPVSREKTGARNAQGVWNWMTFLVGDQVALPEVALIVADLFAADGTQIEAYEMRPSQYGLTWLNTPYASDKPEPRNDVFVEPADYRTMTTVIDCSSPLDPTRRNPMCSQRFRAAELDVQLSYDRTELARWREFQAQVTAFLACATSDPA